MVMKGIFSKMLRGYHRLFSGLSFADSQYLFRWCRKSVAGRAEHSLMVRQVNRRLNFFHRIKPNGLLLAKLYAFGFSFTNVTDQDLSIFFEDRGKGTFRNTEAAHVTFFHYDLNETRFFIPLKRFVWADL